MRERERGGCNEMDVVLSERLATLVFVLADSEKWCS